MYRILIYYDIIDDDLWLCKMAKSTTTNKNTPIVVVQLVISRANVVFWKFSVLDYETSSFRNFRNSNQISNRFAANWVS